MKKTTSLCFSGTGLLNPDSLDWIKEKDIENVVLFGNGSEAAFQHMKDFIAAQPNELAAASVGIGRTPIYDMRVVSADGHTSYPNYLHSEDMKQKWVSAKIASPLIQLSITDVTSKSDTWADLDQVQKELVTYLAYRLWIRMREAESRLCFPATVIDRLIQSTYQLTPQTLDLVLLRQESGLESLNYNNTTDLLEITVAQEVFTVKLDVLNAFYGEFILPMFNSMYGRRLRIQVRVANQGGDFCEPVAMSYGELGRLVEELGLYAREHRISVQNPMSDDDLLMYAKKVKINDESCLWPNPGQTVSDLIEQSQHILVPTNDNYNTPSPVYPEDVPARLEEQAA